jgi:hypothetical protein
VTRTLPSAWPQVHDFFGTPLVIESSPGQLTSDAGLLPVRQFDEQTGLTRAFAEALDDPRDPALTEHSFLEMVRSRVYGILAGYADQNDHDAPRSDPVFQLLADRSPEGHDLASQPTLSRFENAISIPSLKWLRDVFPDQFIASFDTPPRHLTFDLDAVDDPAHGRQQLTFWHGSYDQPQAIPTKPKRPLPAGAGAAFNAPTAGAVFVPEELVRRFETGAAVAALGASATAIAVSRLFLGDEPDFAADPLAFAGPQTRALFYVLGVVAGFLAVACNRTLPGTLALANRLGRWPVEARAGLIGAAVGVPAWFLPHLVGRNV